nr:cupin domain-containing protein [Simiduia agarivorans]
MTQILVIAGLFGTLVPAVNAQTNLQNLQLEGEPGVRVQRLSTDANSSQFYIEIDQAVRPHKHLTHSETIYVIAGEGRMRLGDKTFTLRPGDFVQVPEGEVHGVDVIRTPLKVLSVQAPEFDGTDRVWVE